MLKDDYLQNAIERLGFSKITLGDEKLIAELQGLYQKFFKDRKAGHDDMSVTHNSRDYKTAIAVHNRITETIKPFFDKCFEDYNVFASHFVIKRGKSNETFQLHQDWNIVDEKKYKSYQIWIPLSPSYPENGGICFIPESHLFFDNFRSGSLGIPRIAIEERLYPYLSYLRLFPGEAAVFYNSTLHGSFINSTPEDRIAVIVNIIQNDATPLYFHKQSEANVDAFEIGMEEFIQSLYQLEKGELPFNKIPKHKFKLEQTENSILEADFLVKSIHSVNQEKGRADDYEHKMFNIIKDEKLEKEINHNGFSIINILDNPTLEKLREKFNEVFPDRTLYQGLYSSMQHVSHDERKKLHDFTISTLKNCLDNFFIDYASPISLFYSRRPDRQLYLEWHSDPSILLNQHLEPLYGLWFPLVDLEPSFGTIKIIPGSHRLLNKLIFTYDTFKWPLESKRDLLEKFGVSFKLKAGQALIYDARMIHSSEPNTSSIDRDNIMIRLNHYKSDYYKIITQSTSDTHAADLYKQDKSFFFSKAVKDHKLTPVTGKKAGGIYLFYDDVSEDYIINYLKRFETKNKVLSGTFEESMM